MSPTPTPSSARSGFTGLTFNGVVKEYDGNVAVSEVDLEIRAGETTALVGPSGCGKSTLLRLAVGLIEPDRGQVAFDGRTLTASQWEKARRRIGYVIQEGGLFPHLCARDNTMLMARQLGWDAERCQRRATELAALVQLPPELLDRYPLELSGGQRQRVSLMRALFLDPELLLLDEPLGALDPMIRYELQHELREIFRALGKTVVLVTHDLPEAAYLSDRMVLIRAGQVIQDGAPSELIESPADPFVRDFVQAQRGLADGSCD